MAEKSAEETPDWTYEHPGDHPDNKPPLTMVAVPTDEEKKKYEDAVNAELAKGQPEAASQQNLPEPVVRVELVDPKASAKEGERGAQAAKVNYDEKTVAELKELAAHRNVEIPWDARKDEIIKALEKQDKANAKV